ncbi:MAG: hypothetical protein DBY18_00980 [Clostridia bacterium]|nr:MAG: hypothetical protein DBY18_00980 [Clostridia bacterium]
MAKITVDFSKQKGKIKPVNGVGQPPILYGVDDEMFHYLTEARIPFSRLHDTGGFLGGNRFVDVPNLFRDFDADPDDPAAYDFAFTDVLITSLIKHGVEPFFRLGVSIENDIAIRAYRIDPPKDFHKWAVICEHIIRHYTEGWADGFRYNIRYWEIWNEPDNWEEIELNQEWHATKEVFYEFYGVASIYLKEKFPHLMIGGYGSCGFCSLDGEGTKLANSSPRYAYFVEFFDGFIDYIKAHNCPLDFFSWHSYTTPSRTMGHARYARRRLDEAGYTHTESTCNEWNYRADLRGTIQHAAFTTGMLLGFQDVPLDSAMFYDARCGVSTYSGLFNPLTLKPFPAYYGFIAFGELYTRGTQVESTCDTENVFAVAATGEAGSCLVIANITDKDTPLDLSLGGKKVTVCKCIDATHTYTDCALPETLGAYTVLYMETE